MDSFAVEVAGYLNHLPLPNTHQVLTEKMKRLKFVGFKMRGWNRKDVQISKRALRNAVVKSWLEVEYVGSWWWVASFPSLSTSKIYYPL